MISIITLIKRTLLIIIFITTILHSQNIYAKNCGGNIDCNCGDIVTSSYTLKSDLICNTNQALELKSYKTLNCNGYKISGKQSNIGILIKGTEKNIQIKNCILTNFSTAIDIIKGRYTSGGAWPVTYDRYSLNIKITNSTFSNNQIGIKTYKSINDKFFNNTFINNSKYGIYLNSASSEILNNTFYNSNLFTQTTLSKTFCKNSHQNYYFNSTGPICQNSTKITCYRPKDFGKINSKINLCKDTYHIKTPLLVEKDGGINCQGSVLIGTQNNLGIKTIGIKNSFIKNCNFFNFSTALYLDEYQVKRGGPFVYYYDKHKTIYSQITNNSFQNNLYGIYSANAISNDIFNNTFKNNKINSIYFKEKNYATIYSNLFNTSNINYKTTNGIKFCKNNLSNTFLDFKGPTNCNCIDLKEGLIVDSNIQLCKKDYFLTTSIKIQDNKNLNCNGAHIIGNNKNTAFEFRGIKNTQVKNCIISNFTNAFFYTYRTQRSGWSDRYIVSYNNKITSNKIFNVIYGIVFSKSRYNHDSSAIIHNNSIIAKKYNIYNNLKYKKIDAKYNYWGTSNITEIENKFLKPNLIYYKPYFKSFDIDYYFKNTSIKFLENITKIKIYKENPTFETSNIELEVIIINNYKTKYRKIFNISNKQDLELTYDFIFNFSPQDKLYLIIDPNNKIVEKTKKNNFLVKPYSKFQKIYLNLNTSLPLIDKTIKTYFKTNFYEYTFLENSSNADLIINLKSKPNNFENTLNSKPFTNLKPYQGEILFSQNNSKQIINITGQDIDGLLYLIIEFSKNRDKYLNSKTQFKTEKENLDAIQIYDYLHNFKNTLFYKQNSQKFAKIVNNTLNNFKFASQIQYINITINNQTLKYKLKRLLPENTQYFRQYKDNDLYPIVFSGGLWSNIDSWNKLGQELADQGFEVYLIEMTGGENTECNTCLNYNYSDLTKTVFPTYLNTILNISKKPKLKYIAHSNGARVSLDSISNNYFPQEKIDTLISVGVPGAFEDLSFFAKTIKNGGQTAISNLERKNISHVTISKVINNFRDKKILNFEKNKVYFLFSFIKSLSEEYKISTNLFKQYFSWIKSTDDKQPGDNIKVNKYILIYGNIINLNNDLIVSVKDEKQIFKNIKANNKLLIETKSRHDGMSENKVIKKLISNILNEVEFR